MNTENYIGIPFKKHGRNIKDGVDCYGLVYNIYKNELNIDIPDVKDYEFNKKSINNEVNNEVNNFVKVNNPELYDIGLFEFGGLPTHIGMYMGNDKILHVMINETTVIENINSNRLKGRLYGWYRKSKNSIL